MIAVSRLADLDLEEIYEYGFEAFGRKTATQYATGLWSLFDLIAYQPGLGRAVEGEGSARVTTYKKHQVYYRPMSGGVLILRVLSPRQPVPDQL